MIENTREKIVHAIRSQGRISVNELAEAAGVSPVSVRHHLAALAADQLIKAEEDRHGVGRPRKLYSLTERAFEQTPGRYLRLTHRILERMKDNLTDAEMQALFADIAGSMADEIDPLIRNQPLDQRIQVLSDFLNEEGFAVEIEQEGSQLTLRELACPYFQISREHPEVCAISRTLISRTLGVDVERQQWLMNGDTHCSFSLHLEPAQYGSAPASAQGQPSVLPQEG